jgi:hypothetical protein
MRFPIARRLSQVFPIVLTVMELSNCALDMNWAIAKQNPQLLIVQHNSSQPESGQSESGQSGSSQPESGQSEFNQLDPVQVNPASTTPSSSPPAQESGGSPPPVFSIEGLESNITPEAPLITLGQPCDRPYIVVIPTSNPELLQQVQDHVPTAFLTESRLGSYILAGSAPRRSEASSVTRQLRRQGFVDARVVYRPVRCSAE